jgi:hypothetical protein
MQEKPNPKDVKFMSKAAAESLLEKRVIKGIYWISPTVHLEGCLRQIHLNNRQITDYAFVKVEHGN